jgi:hypothetical protein
MYYAIIVHGLANEEKSRKEGFYAPPVCHGMTENRTGISRLESIDRIYM